MRNSKSVIRGDTLFIDGRIDGMTYDLLMHGNAGVLVRHVELNSFGGDESQGTWIAQVIREKRMATHLREGAFCASTCVLLFAAGMQRTMHPSATLGVHGVRVGGDVYRIKSGELCGASRDGVACSEFTYQWYVESLQATREFFDKLELYGVKSELFSDYLSQGRDPHWFERGNGLQVRDWVFGVEAAREYGFLADR